MRYEIFSGEGYLGFGNNDKPSIKGKMIFIDGPDGSGKSTQVKNIKEYLEDRGYEVLMLRQPGMPGEHGDNVRKALFGEDRYSDFWAVRTLFAAEYLEFMDRYGYETNKVVLCDRNVITSNACIGGAEIGNLDEVITHMSPIYNLAERKPDSIIICNVDAETAMNRLSYRLDNGGDINHYDCKSEWFHKKSCFNYSKMEELEEQDASLLGLDDRTKTIYSVDANKDEDTVTQDIIMLLNKLYLI